jgi:hypothetical protein
MPFAASPWRSTRVNERLPSMSGNSAGAPAATAASGSGSAASASYSTAIRSAASRAADALSATTAATGVPAACTRPSAMIGCGGTRMSATSRFTGMGPRWLTSAPVTTVTTPGSAARPLDVDARDTRVRVMRAQQGHVQAPRRVDVVDVAPGADEER